MITFTTLTLARETIINVFFQSIRENITPSLPHDEEILSVQHLELLSALKCWAGATV